MLHTNFCCKLSGVVSSRLQADTDDLARFKFKFQYKNADWALPDQDGKEEAQAQIEELEKEKKKLERKLAALTAKSSALKEANESQAVTLDGLQVIP